MVKDINDATGLRAKLDRLLIHRVWGYVIFAAILFLIFQAIYDWSEYPMDMIDTLLRPSARWPKPIYRVAPLPAS